MNEVKDKNFVFSPFSIQLALSLLTNGSTGSTKTELLTFLEAQSLDDLNSKSEQALRKLCKNKKGDPILSVIGGVWIDRSLTIKPSFKDNAERVYKAKAETVDFQDMVKSKEAIQKVNRWAEESTNGLIKDVLPEDDFNPARRIILANALYFKGRWLDRFDSKVTKNATFNLLGGDSVEVPFMSSRLYQYIATFDEFKILKLLYDRMSLCISMYILLPNKRDGLWSLIDMVGSDPLFMEKYLSKGSELVMVGEFMVPKFKIDHGFDAKEVLEELGLKSTFSGNAKLGEMAHGASCPVSKVIHRSYIDVNEEGTEAAGVTVIESWECSDGSPPRPKTQVDFVADHPFMFMVKNDISGEVLFMGHVINPSLQ
ncbi:hypothetical protein ACHQM5_008569 [Ranunculus cassubicifolius]